MASGNFQCGFSVRNRDFKFKLRNKSFVASGLLSFYLQLLDTFLTTKLFF